MKKLGLIRDQVVAIHEPATKGKMRLRSEFDHHKTGNAVGNLFTKIVRNR